MKPIKSATQAYAALATRKAILEYKVKDGDITPEESQEYQTILKSPEYQDCFDLLSSPSCVFTMRMA